MKRFAIPLSLLVLTLWGGFHLITQETSSAPNTGRTVLSVYTTGQATTPQLPLWKALADGTLDFTPEIHYWKNLDDLRGLLLAGKGDIWIGHIDGFAQAAMHGAPIRLVSVTGWKKFYILSNDPTLKDFDDLIKRPAGTQIASAPPHSPGVSVMRALETHGVPKFLYAPYEPKQLSLMAMQNKVDILLLPEPLVTVLLKKAPHLHIVGSVEEEYGKLTGNPAMLPLAGIAVNTMTLEKNPNLANTLEAALRQQEHELQQDPEAGLATLPKAFEKYVSREIVLDSLARDIIRIRSARECKDMIQDYLALLFASSSDTPFSQLPDSFYGVTR